MKNKQLVFLTLLLLAGFEVPAVARTWDGGGADNLWTTAANWDGDTNITAGDALVFPGTAPSDSLVNTNDFAANTAFNFITITGTNYTMRGNAIILTNGISHQSGGTNTVALFLQLNADQIFTTAVNGQLDVSGDINLNGQNLFLNPMGRMHIAGVIGGTGTVFKGVSGTLRLLGGAANTYVGSMIVSLGILELSKATNSIPGDLQVGDGNGGVDSAVVRLLGANQVNDSSAVTIEDDGLLDLNGNSDAIGALTVAGGDVTTGAGTLTLGGDVTANASTNIAIISGNLSLGSATRTFSIANGSANPELTISAVISGDAGAGITKNGTGFLRLSGTNTYSGVTTINSAPGLEVANPSALGSASSGTTLSGGGLLFLNGVTVVGETLTSTGISTSLQSSNAAGWSGNVVLDTTIQIAVLSGTNDISGTISSAGGLAKTASGTLILSGTNVNTYSGTTTVNTGTLLLNKSPGVMAIPGPLVIGDGVGGINADVVRLQANSQISDSSTVTIASSGLLDTDGFTEIVGPLSGTGNLQLDASIFSENVGSGTSTFDGVISGSNNLIKNGSGTWILNGTNTFSGVFQLNGGVTLVNGTMPANPTTVAATLGGTGTVGRVSVGALGTLSPGLSPGRLTTSNLQFIVTAKYRVELNGTTPGSGYDQLKVNGTVNNLASATLNATLGFPSAISNVFTIIDNDGTDAVTNTFAGLPEGATLNINGTPFRISYVGGTGNDVTLTQLTASQLPLLNIQASSGTNVVLSWATNFTGFTLEANMNLNTNVWAVVSPPPAISGTNNIVTNAVIESGKFYRLRAP